MGTNKLIADSRHLVNLLMIVAEPIYKIQVWYHKANTLEDRQFNWKDSFIGHI